MANKENCDMSENDTQVGGNHYKHPGEEEHWDRAWRLDYDCFQYIITKWVERWKFKDGIKDLRKAQHAIAKYIEVAEAAEEINQVGVTFGDIAEPDKVSLSAELNNMNEVLGMNCICSTQVPAPEEHMHLKECPARDKLRQPTANERGMEGLYNEIRNLWSEIRAMENHWQGKVNMVSDNEWTYEGGTKDWDEWTCKQCNSHVRTEAGHGPPKMCHMHAVEEGGPTPAYVNQDPDRPRGVCDHGRAFNDYCEPCGRVNGGAT
jgi:rubrerythrin